MEPPQLKKNQTKKQAITTILDGIYFILRREPAALAKLHGEESPRIDGANEDVGASYGNNNSGARKKQKIS